jgi:hypothetical protein
LPHTWQYVEGLSERQFLVVVFFCSDPAMSIESMVNAEFAEFDRDDIPIKLKVCVSPLYAD